MEPLKEEQNEYFFKVIVVGEGGVGKTTFINRYATKRFIEDTKLTIGASFYSFENKVNEYTTIKIQVWDFGGEKRFRFILPSYCKGSHGVIFAFELTRAASLWNLDDWFQLVNENTNNPVVLLIGTKADQIEETSSKALTEAQIEDFRQQYDLSSDLFFKTSSKTGENVEHVFAKLADLLYERVKQNG